MCLYLRDSLDGLELRNEIRLGNVSSTFPCAVVIEGDGHHELEVQACTADETINSNIGGDTLDRGEELGLGEEGGIKIRGRGLKAVRFSSVSLSYQPSLSLLLLPSPSLSLLLLPSPSLPLSPSFTIPPIPLTSSTTSLMALRLSLVLLSPSYLHLHSLHTLLKLIFPLASGTLFTEVDFRMKAFGLVKAETPEARRYVTRRLDFLEMLRR